MGKSERRWKWKWKMKVLGYSSQRQSHQMILKHYTHFDGAEVISSCCCFPQEISSTTVMIICPTSNNLPDRVEIDRARPSKCHASRTFLTRATLSMLKCVSLRHGVFRIDSHQRIYIGRRRSGKSVRECIGGRRSSVS